MTARLLIHHLSVRGTRVAVVFEQDRERPTVTPSAALTSSPPAPAFLEHRQQARPIVPLQQDGIHIGHHVGQQQPTRQSPPRIQRGMDGDHEHEEKGNRMIGFSLADSALEATEPGSSVR